MQRASPTDANIFVTFLPTYLCFLLIFFPRDGKFLGVTRFSIKKWQLIRPRKLPATCDKAKFRLSELGWLFAVCAGCCRRVRVGDERHGIDDIFMALFGSWIKQQLCSRYLRVTYIFSAPSPKKCIHTIFDKHSKYFNINFLGKCCLKIWRCLERPASH